MTKTEIIECICRLNKNARKEILRHFSIDELSDYLEHLMEKELDEIFLST